MGQDAKRTEHSTCLPVLRDWRGLKTLDIPETCAIRGNTPVHDMQFAENNEDHHFYQYDYGKTYLAKCRQVIHA